MERVLWPLEEDFGMLVVAVLQGCWVTRWMIVGGWHYSDCGFWVRE